MFSEELIAQLSKLIIRPHRQIYGLDKLGPKKIIIKNLDLGCYIQIYRHQCTILSAGKKIQLSIFQPHHKSLSSAEIIFQSGFQDNGFMVPNQTSMTLGNKTQLTIFLHTNSGSRLEGLQYSKHLLQHGELVCLFDYSGSGVSEGEFVTMGVNESIDLANVVEYLKHKFDIGKVNLWGRSMGAVTAVLYSSKYPNNVRKMVLDSPFCDFRQLVKEIVNSHTGLPEFLFGVILTKIEQYLKKKLSVNMMDIDLKTEIVKPGMDKIPIFFLLSKDDKLVLPAHVETLYELHRGYKKIKYLDGSHNKPRPTQIRQQCAQFLSHKIYKGCSQKIITGLRKHSVGALNQKCSQMINTTQLKSKITNSSCVFSTLQNNLPIQEHTQNLHSSCNAQKIATNEAFLTNLLKKNRPEAQLLSTLSTPREEHSATKYSNSKISLSQLKKSNTVITDQIPNTKYPKEIHDTKKQSKTTTAIQHKNKIKQHINRM